MTTQAPPKPSKKKKPRPALRKVRCTGCRDAIYLTARPEGPPLCFFCRL